MTINNTKKAMLSIQAFEALSRQASKLTGYEREQADILVSFSAKLLGAYLAGLEYYEKQRFSLKKLKLYKVMKKIEVRVRVFISCATDYINKAECAFVYRDFSVWFAHIMARFDIGVGFQMQKKQLTHAAYCEPKQSYLIDVASKFDA